MVDLSASPMTRVGSDERKDRKPGPAQTENGRRIQRARIRQAELYHVVYHQTPPKFPRSRPCMYVFLKFINYDTMGFPRSNLYLKW